MISVCQTEKAQPLLCLMLVAFMFFNVLNNHVSHFVPLVCSMMFILIIFILILLQSSKKNINIKLLLYIGFMLMAVCFSALSAMTKAPISQFGGMFYLSFPVLLLLFLLLPESRSFLKSTIKSKFWLILFLINVLAVVYGKLGLIYNIDPAYLLVNVTASSYTDSVLGLYGQPSVASTLLVVFWLTVCYSKQLSARGSLKHWSHGVLVLSLLAVHAGTGLFIYCFVMGYILFRARLFGILFLVLSFAIYILMTYHDPKFSYQYFIFMLNYFMLSAHLYTGSGAMAVLFGGGPQISDFGWLTILSVTGLLYFVLLTALVFGSIIKNTNIFLKSVLFSLYVSSFHYTVMFWPVSQILLALIIMDTYAGKSKAMQRVTYVPYEVERDLV